MRSSQFQNNLLLMFLTFFSNIFEDLSYKKKLFIILNIHSGNNAVKCVKRIYLIKKKNSNYCLSF